MKAVRIKSFLIASLATVAAACSSSSETASKKKSHEYVLEDAGSASLTPVSDTDLVGTWATTVQTRRGTRENTLTISMENNVLKGRTENDNFTISKSGNTLRWQSQIDSPMGKLTANYEVVVDGNQFSGHVSASGRKINVSGKKLQY